MGRKWTPFETWVMRIVGVFVIALLSWGGKTIYDEFIVDNSGDFPIFLNDVENRECHTRSGGTKCIFRREIRTPPDKGGIGSVEFAIPVGSKSFSATVSHYDKENCDPLNNARAGVWSAEVWTDGRQLEIISMANRETYDFSVEIPESSKWLELRGVDDNDYEICDDPAWNDAKFSDIEPAIPLSTVRITYDRCASVVTEVLNRERSSMIDDYPKYAGKPGDAAESARIKIQNKVREYENEPVAEVVTKICGSRP